MGISGLATAARLSRSGWRTVPLLSMPYDERRDRLAGLPMPDPYLVSVVRGFTFIELDADRRTPADLLAHVAATGYEGLIAKRRTSTYSPGRRSDAWLKHALTRTTEVIVCGYRPGQGRIAGRMGGLALGAHDPDTGALLYIGDVGTGFTEAGRSRLQQRLEPLERRTHPFAVAPPRADIVRVRWVEPELVGEVEFRTFTSAGRVRHTAWRGLREDRKPGDVVAPGPVPVPDQSPVATPAEVRPAAEPSSPPSAPAEFGPRVTVQAGNRRLTLSNLDKVLYPDGTTKGEVLNYYSRVAEVILPHLAGRPVTFVASPTVSADSSSSRRTSRTADPTGSRPRCCPARAAAGGRVMPTV